MAPDGPGELAELLREMETLAQGSDGHPQEIARRFLECTDWQKCANLIALALQESLEKRHAGPRLSPPPAWLPPLT